MGNVETFDPKDVGSITKLADQLAKCSSNGVNENILFVNMRKGIKELKQLKQCDYDTVHTSELLRLMINISIFSGSKQIMDEIIKLGLHSVFRELIVYQLEKKDMNYEILNWIYSTLLNLTGKSIKFARQNQENGFFKLTIDLFDRLGFNISSTINNNQSFALYDRLICFVLNNAQYNDMRDSLIKNGFAWSLSNDFNKLNNLKGSKCQINYVMMSILKALSLLLNENGLDTLTLSNEVVDQFINALNECIKNSKTNTQVLQNTKFYNKYSIGNSTSYQFASGYLECVRIIAVNDRVKQKLYEKGIMSIVERILIDGNQKEFNNCTDLLCALCFNQNVVGYLASHHDL